MKITAKEPFTQNGFFTLHTNEYLDKQRKVGKIAANVLNHMERLVHDKTNLSLLELDAIAEKIITDSGAKPTFKGYNSFPASLCISVNEQLVHGIPSEYYLKDGDIIKFDVGVTLDESIVDTAITCIYGTPKYDWHVNLLNITNEALNKGIKSISIDKKLGVIGNAIYKYINDNGFSVITNYGGHAIGIDNNGNGILHASPFVSNKSSPDEGFRIQPGLVLAIEPMAMLGSTKTYTDKSGWTVIGESVSAHYEHTVFIHEDSVEVITDRKKYENTI